MKGLINGEKIFERKRIIIILAVALAVCIITILLGFTFMKSPKNIAEGNLESVLKIVLIFPEKSLDTAYRLSTGKNISDTTNEDIPTIGEEITEAISPYFTENGVKAFINHQYEYGAFCVGTYWKTEVKSIRINSDKNAERTLLFTANILCKNTKAEKLELILTGKAQYDKTGKLNYLRLSDTSVLELNSLNRTFQIEAGLYDK